MRAVRGFVSFVAPPRRRLFFRSRRDGQGVTSDRKDGPIGEMSDDESSAAKLAKCDLVAGFEEEVDNECCICLVDMEERKFRGKMDCCDHVVCWFCIQEWSQKTARTCPICQRGFHKCKKTKARRKKGRRHTSAQSSDRTKKKERTLWENVRKRFATARPPSSSLPRQSWSEAEDGDEALDAGEEEVILISPMHDSRDEGGVAEEQASGSNSNVDNGSRSSSSSNEDGEEANDSDRNNNGSDSSSEGGGAGRVTEEEEAGRGGGNVDEEAEVAAAVDVEEEEEAEAEGNEVGRSADVSSSREGEPAADAAEETSGLVSLFLPENDGQEEEEGMVGENVGLLGEKRKEKEKEVEVEVEDEEEVDGDGGGDDDDKDEESATDTNFVAGYDDPKGKGKEEEEDGGVTGKEEEEWERKGSESDGAYKEQEVEEEEEEEEEEDSYYDDNGPIRLPEDN